MEPTVFGLTEPEIAELGMTWGVGGLIVMMLAIIWKVAHESRAGRFGTFVLFFVLAFGIAGFLAKKVIAWVLGLD
jgi:NAD/NADP transhydrogenase beta subunit